MANAFKTDCTLYLITVNLIAVYCFNPEDLLTQFSMYSVKQLADVKHFFFIHWLCIRLKSQMLFVYFRMASRSNQVVHKFSVVHFFVILSWATNDVIVTLSCATYVNFHYHLLHFFISLPEAGTSWGHSISELLRSHFIYLIYSHFTPTALFNCIDYCIVAAWVIWLF